MYLYFIEKKINIESFNTDILLIQNCLANTSEIHILLGKLFGVNNIPNFREKYNILYKFINNGSFKLLIKSDIEIKENILKELNFILIEKKEINIIENNILTFNILVSPTKKVDNKRILIKNKKDRIDWLKNKLTYNDECVILYIDEINEKTYNMSHKNSQKGCTSLYGYEYALKVKINNKQSFEKLIQKGIGPEKCYGFGLIDYVSYNY